MQPVAATPSRRPALALALAVAGPVGPRIEVIWDAPASCPDAATARAEILARVADRPAAHELEAAARVHALDDGTWEVEVVLRSDAGTATRTLQAASCNEALTATAVVVAIAVDPSLAAESTAAVTSSTLVPPPPTGPAPSIAPAPTAEPPPAIEPAAAVDVPRPPASPAPRAPDPAATRQQLGLSLVARGGLDLGALPSPAGHVAAAVGLFGRRFEVQAGALHRIRHDTSLSSLPQPVGGRFRLTVAQLRAGPRLSWGALELPLATGLELGAIWAQGIGAVEPIPVRRPWVAAVASAGLGWAPRTSFVLQLGVDGVIPLVRPTFTLDPDVEVLTVGPIAARAWLGVAGRFSL